MSLKWMLWAFEQKVGNALTKLVLLKLADNANDKGECWPSVNYLAKHTEISRRTIQAHIHALHEAGFIQVYRRRNGIQNLSNVYQLVDRGVVQDLHQGGAAAAGGVVQQPHPNLSLEPVTEPSLAGKRTNLSGKKQVAGGTVH